MVEVLVGICLFSLAILPMVWLNTNQTKNAFSAGKHMMAGQLAASYMDNLLKRSYEDLESFTSIPKTLVLNSVNDESMFDLQALISDINDNSDEELKSAEENMKTAFKNFQYQIDVEKNDSKKIIKIDVEVFYRVVEGDNKAENEQSVKLSAFKYGNLDE